MSVVPGENEGTLENYRSVLEAAIEEFKQHLEDEVEKTSISYAFRQALVVPQPISEGGEPRRLFVTAGDLRRLLASELEPILNELQNSPESHSASASEIIVQTLILKAKILDINGDPDQALSVAEEAGKLANEKSLWKLAADANKVRMILLRSSGDLQGAHQCRLIAIKCLELAGEHCSAMLIREAIKADRQAIMAKKYSSVVAAAMLACWLLIVLIVVSIPFGGLWWFVTWLRQ